MLPLLDEELPDAARHGREHAFRACRDDSLLLRRGRRLADERIEALFATGLVGTRSPYGEVENAYVPARISGGSSSGSAVSVACGLAAFALGTDTAGSGRVPAMLNALVGWKPALGAWSTKGVVPACASLDCVTVFAHTLGEAEAVDGIVRGYDAACRWSRPLVRKAAALPKKILLPADGLQFFGQTAQAMEQK